MTDPRLLELDATKLGEALVTAYLVSVQLGHQHVRDTLRDYYHPGPDDHEQAFLVDLLNEPNGVIAERWFGGMDRVREILARRAQARAWSL